jgi:hypothetical protein
LAGVGGPASQAIVAFTGLAGLAVLAGLAGVLICVAVARAIYNVQVRNIDSYEEVLDLAIREAKEWKSPQKSDEATMPMEQGINKEHELKCQGFNLVKPYPFQSDVV